MAIKKFRFRPEGVNDYSDILHPETSADIVLLEDKAGNFSSNNVEGALAELYSHRVPITRKINNKELSQDITLSASDVGAAPASHVGSGGSAHATATTSTAGFMSAADKTKLNKLKSVDETVYGSVTYTDTIAAGNTLRKTIAIGSGKTEGKAVITPKNHGADGVLVFFTTDATRTYAVGGAQISTYGKTGGALRRDIAGFVTSGADSFDGVGLSALGNNRIGITNMYISGSSIIIDFYNGGTSSEKLNCTIAWEVR